MAAQLQWVTAVTVQMMAGWWCNHNEQWWGQWATAGVTMGEGNCDSTIAKENNGGGAMDGGMAVQL